MTKDFQVLLFLSIYAFGAQRRRLALGLLMIVGLVGCVLPIIPGPPLSFIGLLLLHFSKYAEYSFEFLLMFGLIAVIVTVLDYIVPIWGTKKFGGSKAGMWGAAIGLVLGLIFLPPLGIEFEDHP